LNLLSRIPDYNFSANARYHGDISLVFVYYIDIFLRRYLKRFFLAVLFISFTLKVVAPAQKFILIYEPSPVTPFTALMNAIATVETMGNSNAYNEKEQAAGVFQIRQVRIDEYNRLTGNKYTLKDVFDREISEKIFLYFASRIGPYRIEKIARDWNGSGPKTELYWRKVKKYL